MGSVSAAMTTNSDTPRFSVFVAASTWCGMKQTALCRPHTPMQGEG